MARRCGTNALTGTDEFAMCRGLRGKLAGRGWRVRLDRGEWADILALNGPAMAALRESPGEDHWVVVLGADSRRIVVGDPRHGPVCFTREWFLDRWRGVLVTVEDGSLRG
jgi:ABC-type bacteriocin/lantibiotic exporter with double-glycine peptidase domain